MNIAQAKGIIPQRVAGFNLPYVILDRVLRHANTLGDAPLTYEKEAMHLAKIQRLVEQGQPIAFVLPAFPAKSPNPQKTLGALPDMGEVMALKFLNGLCEEIGQIYEPGAKIIICSDGRVFSDLVQVPDEAVNRYSQQIQRILQEENFTHLSTYSLEDQFPNLGYDAMRAALVRNHARPLSDHREDAQNLETAKLMFNGIHRFIFEDRWAVNAGASKNQVRKVSKEIAYQVIQRSNAWSALVEEKFPSAVRLSIHPQTPNSPKIGIRMMKCHNRWATPWHSVSVFDGKDFYLMKRFEAEMMNAELVNPRCPYYVTRRSKEMEPCLPKF